MKVGRIVLVAALGATFLSNAALAYTDKQADDGHVKFNNHCAQCHGPKLDGALGPNLHDDKFRKIFANKPVKELRNFVWENMPQTAPKSLPDDQLDPIIAWILKNNKVPADDKPVSKASADSAQFAPK